MASRVETAASGLPVVAIVGRPNVGKSTLFNRIVRSRRAIVDDAPGVTRDRVVAPAVHEERAFLCVDTGGFLAEGTKTGGIDEGVRAQALAAVDEADVLVCVVDGHAGRSPVDRDTIRLLARSGKPLLLAVNKIDSPTRDDLAHEFHSLGIEHLYPVSSAHNRGIDELLDAVVAALPAGSAVPAKDAGTMVALVGRPNVGKSSLLNRLLGTVRVLVSPRPGTTRDSVDTPIVVGGRPYVLVDTAGIRKRGRAEDQLERHGAVRALGTIGRADVVLVVLDATDGLTDQDARIVGRAWQAGRGVILLANKWDLLSGKDRDVTRFRDRVRGLHPGFADLPILCVSAETGEGLESLFNQVTRVERGYRATFTTPALNKALRDAVAAHAPPSPGGRAIRLFYATQTASAPPELTIFTNAPGSIPPDYTRYLSKRFAEVFDVVGTPIRVSYRPRRNAPDGGPTARAGRGTAPRTRRNSVPKRGSARSPRR